MKHLLFVICLLPFMALSAFSQSPEIQIQSLKGLPGIAIAMHKYPNELEQDGLTMKEIGIEAEMRLRKAGIKVLTLNEAMMSPGSPLFEIEIGAVKSDAGIYAVSIRLKLDQNVITQRLPSIGTHVATWEVGNLVMVGRNNLRQVKDEVGDGMDIFINDFLSANPKPK